jgi:1-acyl-sn-glycerol-3-phosphate acyltransferase
VGTIPVDLESSRREAMRLCEDYLRQSRAVVALQGRGRINPKAPHPYISPFKKGASILAYSLYRDYGISVAVTPLAIYGTQTLWGIPGKISVNVGEPMYIDPYLGGDFGNCIDAFRNALEARVRSLFIELIKT